MKAKREFVCLPEDDEEKPTLTEWLENRNKEGIGKWYNSDFLLDKIKSGEFQPECNCEKLNEICPKCGERKNTIASVACMCWMLETGKITQEEYDNFLKRRMRSK